MIPWFRYCCCCCYCCCWSCLLPKESIHRASSLTLALCHYRWRSIAALIFWPHCIQLCPHPQNCRRCSDVDGDLNFAADVAAAALELLLLLLLLLLVVPAVVVVVVSSWALQKVQTDPHALDPNAAYRTAYQSCVAFDTAILHRSVEGAEGKGSGHCVPTRAWT